MIAIAGDHDDLCAPGGGLGCGKSNGKAPTATARKPPQKHIHHQWTKKQEKTKNIMCFRQFYDEGVEALADYPSSSWLLGL